LLLKQKLSYINLKISFSLLFIKHKIYSLKWKNSPLFINFILLETNAILYTT
jgi:hypothetical protein